MISLRPAPRLLPVALLLFLPALALPFFPSAAVLWWTLLGSLITAAAVDALRLFQSPLPQVRRSVASSLPVGRVCKVELRLHVPSPQRRASARPRAVRALLTDFYPPAGRQSGLPCSVQLPPHGEELSIYYRYTPLERGVLSFFPAALLLSSPWGLWRRHLRSGKGQQIRVYPDFRAVLGYQLLTAEGRTPFTGERRSRRRGEGTEFEQLREFRSGDPLRKVDWKATARFGMLISRQYTEEHDQRVVFLLDTGYRVAGGEQEELSHFDHMLNALLLVSYIALQQGDKVGLFTFGADQRRLPPSKGGGMINLLMNTVFDLQAQGIPTDPGSALEQAAGEATRRTLFVVLTKLQEEDGERLCEAANAIGSRHMVLLASIEEQAIGKLLTPLPSQFDQAVVHAAAVRYLRRRRQTIERLRRQGLHVFEAPPKQLPAALSEQYRYIKRAGLL